LQLASQSEEASGARLLHLPSSRLLPMFVSFCILCLVSCSSSFPPSRPQKKLYVFYLKPLYVVNVAYKQLYYPCGLLLVSLAGNFMFVRYCYVRRPEFGPVVYCCLINKHISLGGRPPSRITVTGRKLKVTACPNCQTSILVL
jgi:hypothetical protein